ncbi:MAG: esterase-like activity of phytase family protein, partial [Pseudomonadota bacterium]
MLWRFGLALILSATVASSDPLTFAGKIALRSDLDGFGGLSAIEMRSGDEAIVLSDRGRAFSFNIDRAAQTVTAQPVPIPWTDRDTEGLAWANGQLFFSFEGPAVRAPELGRTLKAKKQLSIGPG